MDYPSIHDRFIHHFRQTTPHQRLTRRNPNDPRLTHASLYVEVHHVIPRTLGGLDVADNLVTVLPEEHLFLHMLRYRIHGQRTDALAVRCMLNGHSHHRMRDTRIALTKQLRMGYAWVRAHAQTIRSTHGWQTPDGVRRIVEARKGKMPAKDALTGQLVGPVDVTHPNVLSGRWVHHTKGRKQSPEEKARHPKYLGQTNPNASGLSDEYFVAKGVEAYREFGVILSWDRMLELSAARGFPWIKSLRSRFGGQGPRGYYAAVEQQTQSTYDPYRSRMLSPKGHPIC